MAAGATLVMVGKGDQDLLRERDLGGMIGPPSQKLAHHSEDSIIFGLPQSATSFVRLSYTSLGLMNHFLYFCHLAGSLLSFPAKF